jgi:gluconate 2-dehydrogenase gamma chain
MSELDRRELLRQLALLSSSLAAWRCEREKKTEHADVGPASADSGLLAEAPSSSGSTHALSPFQRSMLEAATSRILPTDQDPGAKEANVIEFIDRELARPEYALLKSNVLAGVVALRNTSIKKSGKLFTELSADEQDEVLREVEALGPQGKDFIRILIELSLEGFLGDPLYGGNVQGVGWQFIGYGPGNPDGSGTGGHHH